MVWGVRTGILSSQGEKDSGLDGHWYDSLPMVPCVGQEGWSRQGLSSAAVVHRERQFAFTVDGSPILCC